MYLLQKQEHEKTSEKTEHRASDADENNFRELSYSNYILIQRKVARLLFL